MKCKIRRRTKTIQASGITDATIKRRKIQDHLAVRDQMQDQKKDTRPSRRQGSQMQRSKEEGSKTIHSMETYMHMYLDDGIMLVIYDGGAPVGVAGRAQELLQPFPGL
jgi:hypothetical protein